MCVKLSAPALSPFGFQAPQFIVLHPPTTIHSATVPNTEQTSDGAFPPTAANPALQIPLLHDTIHVHNSILKMKHRTQRLFIQCLTRYTPPLRALSLSLSRTLSLCVCRSPCFSVAQFAKRARFDFFDEAHSLHAGAGRLWAKCPAPHDSV